MGVTGALGEKPAASKHGLSFGGTFSNALLAALSLLAVDCLDIANKKNAPLAIYPLHMFGHAKMALAEGHPLVPFGDHIPQPDFAIPASVHETNTNSLALSCHCSPFGNCGNLDINDLEEAGVLLDPPDEQQLKEIDSMIALPDDTLFDNLRLEKDERFQNGLGQS
jgi:hypothetical protein